jgi:non-specific serine/threonine protein kinase
LTALIGRDQEKKEVGLLLRQHRLLTLTGVGGIGKTRLGLAVAAEAAVELDAQAYFVALKTVRRPEMLLPAIARAAGAPEGSAPLLDTVAHYLGGRRCLALLDNFEQVISAADTVEDLLQRCPHLTALVTSRQRLNLTGEREWPVPTLELPTLNHPPDLVRQNPAVRLFVERAIEADSTFVLIPDHVFPVAEICIKLEGLPLAIELAASWVKLLSPPQLLDELQRPLAVLGGVLRATLDRSYDLLKEAEQRLFRHLCVFVGGCDLAGAAAVCLAPETESSTLLWGIRTLSEKSLIRPVGPPDGQQRYVMLEPIREYGLERLEQSGEADLVRKRHAAFFSQVATDAEPRLTSSERPADILHLEGEHGNLSAALEYLLHSESLKGLEMAGSLFWFWHFRDHLITGQKWLERALDAGAKSISQDGSNRELAARAKALSAAGRLAWLRDDATTARSCLTDAVFLYRRLRCRPGLGMSLCALGQVECGTGDTKLGCAHVREGIDVLRHTTDRWGLALCLHNLGRILTRSGDADARSLLQESRGLFVQLGDKWGEALAAYGLAAQALENRAYGEATALFEEAITVWRDCGDRWLTARTLYWMGEVRRRQGKCADAVPLYEESLRLHRDLGKDESATIVEGQLRLCRQGTTGRDLE